MAQLALHVHQRVPAGQPRGGRRVAQRVQRHVSQGRILQRNLVPFAKRPCCGRQRAGSPALAHRPRSALRIRVGITNTGASVASPFTISVATCEMVLQHVASRPGPISTPAELVGLSRPAHCLSRTRLLVRAIDNDDAPGSSRVASAVCSAIASEMRRPARDQDLRQRPVHVYTAVEVERNLVQAQIVVLDVRGGQALDAGGRQAGGASLTAAFRHDEGAQSVVDGLPPRPFRLRPPRPGAPSIRGRARRQGGREAECP